MNLTPKAPKALLTKCTRPLGALAMASALTLGAGPALAQESTPTAEQIDLTNAPVDMHEGTCADLTLDPWDEIGRLERLRFSGLDDDDAAGPFTDYAELSEDTDDDGELDEGEDLDDDGIIDTGFDVNENDVLEEDELVDGDDLADDEVLEVDEIVDEGEAAILVVNPPTAWTTNGVIDAPFDPIFNQPNAIAVHQSSDQYENLVACANVQGFFDGDQDEVVVGLNPVDQSGVRGYAVFEYDSVLFGNDETRVTVYLFSGLPTQRDTAAMATPTS